MSTMRSSIYKHRATIVDVLLYVVSILIAVSFILVFQFGARQGSALFHLAPDHLKSYVVVSLVCYGATCLWLILWLIAQLTRARLRIHQMFAQEDRVRQDFCGND